MSLKVTVERRNEVAVGFVDCKTVKRAFERFVERWKQRLAPPPAAVLLIDVLQAVMMEREKRVSVLCVTVIE